ncbi:MAG: hypothetical protein A2137_03525 [Chloroflexi bacterium RBG_16_58_8]|nr:MAG: hypothetical protein A2137_03525 [Chloroflexi bacterium RBG_16_58_8]
MKNTFEKEKNPPKKLSTLLTEHLVYAYGAGEKGFYWEAGPDADFTEILYIFSTPTLAKAKRQMRGDPFYQEGIFHDDFWFEWRVHVPPWKIRPADREMMEGLMRYVNILPDYPPGAGPPVKEIHVEAITPPRLFVSISRAKSADIKKLERDQQAGKPVPAFFINHAFYRLGAGGTVTLGYDWEAGPSADQTRDLTVMSAGSMEMARLLRENDPVSQHGLFYDHRYFEWRIMWPLKKASPLYQDTLKRLLKQAGLKLA